MIFPKRVVFGVTASISAYKAPLIVRELIKAGAEVRVVMSPSARHFVSPLTLANLSRNPVVEQMFDADAQRDGSWHIELARWCDTMLIAPCSADTLARLASGACDTALALVAVALPRESQLVVAPAMDPDMWWHPATQRNVAQLRRDGAQIIEPEYGEMASGLVGVGRLPEPPTLLEALRRPGGSLQGTTVLITAGPTREKIDDVRYLSNHSSGKMGYALAAEARRRGARVLLVSGPVSLPPPADIDLFAVTSAQEMFEQVMALREQGGIFIMAAAVADFRPCAPPAGKLKKEELGEQPTLHLERTPDILAELGRRKEPGQLVIGFALEAENGVVNARGKLERKNCDMLVLNLANRDDSGFGGDSNTVTLLWRDGRLQDFPPMSKASCASVIWDQVAQLGQERAL